jgi:hypothetical protein
VAKALLKSRAREAEDAQIQKIQKPESEQLKTYLYPSTHQALSRRFIILELAVSRICGVDDLLSDKLSDLSTGANAISPEK